MRHYARPTSLAFACLIACHAGCTASDETRSLTSCGYDRTYHLHLPPAATSGDALPLVLALHGGYGTGLAMRRMTGYDQIADADGFIVVYPDGLHAHWADGRGTTWPDRHGVNDVAFIAAVIDDVGRLAAVDRRRIYATGISNGGMMCERLGLQLGSRIAAIAPVAGNLPIPLSGAPPAGTPSMPVLMINGTADPAMPYDGGAVDGGGSVLSVDQTIAFWRTLDHVATLGAPATTALPNIDPNDGCTVNEIVWPGGQRTQEVLYQIVGGGHTWPGQPPSIFGGVGNICMDISASAVIWSFFSVHPKLAPAG